MSHAETVRVFQRACERAGIKVQYSKGFNPRPKLSLPLPRSVGVEADGDLLCLGVHDIRNPIYEIRNKLSEQLPDGCELLSVVAVKTNKPPHPSSAAYLLPIKRECIDEKLNSRIEHLLSSENIVLERSVGAKISNFKFQISNSKSVDVRGFLKSMELDDKGITVECKIGSAGSIRVDEILKLLELDYAMLAGPIRRTNILWSS